MCDHSGTTLETKECLSGLSRLQRKVDAFSCSQSGSPFPYMPVYTRPHAEPCIQTLATWLKVTKQQPIRTCVREFILSALHTDGSYLKTPDRLND